MDNVTRNRIKSLARLVFEKQVIFLCGAGMSKGSKLPLADHLRAEMVQVFLDQNGQIDPKESSLVANSFPLEAIAGAYELEYGDDRLLGLLREKYRTASSPLHDGHKALEELATAGYINKVYTTNFDDLIEKAFAEPAGRGVSVTDSDANYVHRAMREGKFPVIHLHGKIDEEAGNPLITEKKTYQLDTPLARLLMADMVTHSFVLVGYSLSDPDLRSIYFSMNAILSRGAGLAKKPYVVHPLRNVGSAVESLELHFTSRLWDARNMTYLPLTAEEFLPTLAMEVDRVLCDDFAKQIASQNGLDPENPGHVDKVWEEARNLYAHRGVGDQNEWMKALAIRYRIEVKQ